MDATEQTGVRQEATETTARPTLDREAIRSIKARVLRVLKDNGFTPQPRGTTTTHEAALTRAIEEACEWTADVEPQPQPTFEPLPHNLDGQKFNRLTFDVAMEYVVCRVPGVDDLDFLDNLRLCLGEMLEAMGYMNPSSDLGSDKVHWRQYSKRWTDLCETAARLRT